MSGNGPRIEYFDNEEIIRQLYKKEKDEYETKVDLERRDLDSIRKRALIKIPLENNEPVKKIIGKVDKAIFKNPTNSDLNNLENFNKSIYCAARTVIELWKRKSRHESLIKVLPTTRLPEDAASQTELYRNCRKNFARLLLLPSIVVDDVPRIDELEKFWEDLWGDANGEQLSDAEAQTAKNERDRIEKQGNLRDMPSEDITIQELKKVLRGKKQWSPAGIDGIQTFWYKHFKNTHCSLLRLINEAMKNPEAVPGFLTEGITLLSPKEPESTIKTSGYRPITILPEMYKIITKCLCVRIRDHLTKYNMLAGEQMAGRSDCLGIKMPLILHSIALTQNDCRAYIDYKKAYDMLPHSWLIEILKIYKVDSAFITFLESVMKNWCTTLYLERCNGEVLVSKKISMKRGIFQGDSLSVLWYCMAINPLSFQLRELGPSTNLSHLLYVDDLVVFSKNAEDLKNLLRVVLKFTKNIKMKINFNKSNYFSARDGEITSITFGEDTIECASEEEYKYLGYSHHPRLSHEKMIKSKISSFKRNVERVMKTGLELEDKIKAIKALVLPKIFQTFGVLAWDESLDFPQLEMWLDGLLRNDPGYLDFELTTNDHSINFEKQMEEEVKKLRRHFRSAARKADSEWLEETMKNDKNVTPLNLSNLV